MAFTGRRGNGSCANSRPIEVTRLAFVVERARDDVYRGRKKYLIRRNSDQLSRDDDKERNEKEENTSSRVESKWISRRRMSIPIPMVNERPHPDGK